MNTLINDLQIFRKRNGLTQRDVGILTDISQTDISNMEKGKTIATEDYENRLRKMMSPNNMHTAHYIINKKNGIHVKEVRKRACYTQTQFARLSGIGIPILKKIESGVINLYKRDDLREKLFSMKSFTEQDKDYIMQNNYMKVEGSDLEPEAERFVIRIADRVSQNLIESLGDGILLNKDVFKEAVREALKEDLNQLDNIIIE